MCLNPCSNGRCSARNTIDPFISEVKRLNPCSNGRCSASVISEKQVQDGEEVLILVLMEDALRVCERMKQR